MTEVLIVDDDESLRDSLRKTLEKEGYSVSDAPSGTAGIERIRREPPEAALVDLKMPDMSGLEFLKSLKAIAPEVEAIMMTGFGTIETAVEAMREGAYDFVTKPFKRHAIVNTLRKALEKRSLLAENRQLRSQLELALETQSVVGNSRAIREIMELVEQVAPSSATVLIQGDSGSGKEWLANVIHSSSPRKGKPFIKVSCAALPETLLEAELFGYERGAFTGAVSRKEGRFELAHGGTLFLDEVGEISPAMQVKLLRVLQTGEFERLGGTKTVRSDVRLIAATNADLKAAMKEGRFREDLFYRLNVITMTMPSLRDRLDDLPLLATHFVQVFREKNGKRIRGISSEAMELMKDYSWPGNVRELENTMERAVVLSKDDMITPQDLPENIAENSDLRSEIAIPMGMPLEEVERKIIKETLRRSNGEKATTAKLLGISTRTIYRKLGPEALKGDAGESRDQTD
jgi:two-component system response regulator HydG